MYLFVFRTGSDIYDEFFAKPFLAVRYVCEKLQHRCLAGFQTRLWQFNVRALHNYYQDYLYTKKNFISDVTYLDVSISK